MKRGRRLSSRFINFSVALIAVLLAHAALLWVWQADMSVPVVTVGAVNAGNRVTAMIVTTTTPKMRVPVKPLPASPPEVLPPQANLDKALQSPPRAESIPETLTAARPEPLSAPLQIPAAIRLHYAVEKGSSSADAVLSWHILKDAVRQRSAYELTLEVKLGFMTVLQQTSTGELAQRGLAPERYSDKRLRKSEQATHFDAAAGTVTFSNNRPQAAWVLGLQDRLSVLVQLAALAQGKAASAPGSHWAAGDIVALPVASTDELEPWQWEVQAQGAQDKANSSNEIKLLRRPRRAYDASIELWLSPAIGYLPSRIRQTDSFGVTDQTLVRAEPL